jgi:hypothetical protein
MKASPQVLERIKKMKDYGNAKSKAFALSQSQSKEKFMSNRDRNPESK